MSHTTWVKSVTDHHNIRAYPALYLGGTPSQKTGIIPLAVNSSITVYISIGQCFSANLKKQFLLNFAENFLLFSPFFSVLSFKTLKRQNIQQLNVLFF